LTLYTPKNATDWPVPESKTLLIKVHALYNLCLVDSIEEIDSSAANIDWSSATMLYW